MPRDINDPAAGERQVGVFLGAATAEMTVGEAFMVNRSGLSGEWWPREGVTLPDGTVVDDLILDALGPVLVTRAAIPSNRDGQANANVEIGYARAASGAWRGPVIRSAKQSNQKEIIMGNKATKAINLAAASLAKTADACCKTCAGEQEEETDENKTAAPVAAMDDIEGTGDAELNGDDTEQDTDQDTDQDMSPELEAALARIDALETVVAEHDQILAQMVTANLDVEGFTIKTASTRSSSDRRRIANLPDGFSYGTLREEVENAVRALADGEGEWAWLRDFDDTHVIYEHGTETEDGFRYVNYRAPWSFSDGAASIDAANRTEVVEQFVPAGDNNPVDEPDGETVEQEAPVEEPATV